MIYKFFSCSPNIPRIGHHAVKPIESVVYFLNNEVTSSRVTGRICSNRKRVYCLGLRCRIVANKFRPSKNETHNNRLFCYAFVFQWDANVKRCVNKSWSACTLDAVSLLSLQSWRIDEWGRGWEEGEPILRAENFTWLGWSHRNWGISFKASWRRLFEALQFLDTKFVPNI